MNKTIAVIGSSRRNGNTGRLIDLIAEQLNIEVIDLSAKNISVYDYDQKYSGDDFLAVMDHLLAHDNIIFASPVYWYSMSAQMKTFVDRLSDFLSAEELKDKGRQLRYKIAYVVSTSINETADDSFLDSFINTFEYLGIKYSGAIHVDCNNGFDEDLCNSDIDDFVKKVQA